MQCKIDFNIELDVSYFHLSDRFSHSFFVSHGRALRRRVEPFGLAALQHGKQHVSSTACELRNQLGARDKLEGVHRSSSGVLFRRLVQMGAGRASAVLVLLQNGA
jgi:hypothetical protein